MIEYFCCIPFIFIYVQYIFWVHIINLVIYGIYRMNALCSNKLIYKFSENSCHAGCRNVGLHRVYLEFGELGSKYSENIMYVLSKH